MKTYECPTCFAVNHAARLHCQVCDTVPAMYSFTGAPINGETYRSIVAAHGCDRQEKHKASRINLRTVVADYYAQGE